MLFVINKHCAYFVIKGDIDTSLMTECDFYGSIDELYQAVSKLTQDPLDVIEGQEFTFKEESDGTWMMYDTHGHGYDIITDKNIEEYMSNWSL